MIYDRQLNLTDAPNYEGKVIIIGAGGIGGATALAMTKIGFKNILVIDDDEVEEHNLPSQMFFTGDTNRSKAGALQNVLTWFSDNDRQFIRGIVDRFPGEERIDIEEKDIILVCVDSMEQRKIIWDFFKDLKWAAYIEGRMGGEIFKIYSVEERTKENYDTEEILYDDDDAVQEVCTARAIVYNTFAIGAFITSIVKKIIAEEPYPFELGVDLINYEIIKTTIQHEEE